MHDSLSQEAIYRAFQGNGQNNEARTYARPIESGLWIYRPREFAMTDSYLSGRFKACFGGCRRNRVCCWSVRSGIKMPVWHDSGFSRSADDFQIALRGERAVGERFDGDRAVALFQRFRGFCRWFAGGGEVCGLMREITIGFVVGLPAAASVARKAVTGSAPGQAIVMSALKAMGRFPGCAQC